MNSKTRKTWTTTTTATAILSDGQHIQHFLAPTKPLDRWVAEQAHAYGKRLLRVAFCRTEICDQDGDIADLTTSWYSQAELAEMLERLHAGKL